METDAIFLILATFLAGFIAGWLNHAKLIFNRLIENPDPIMRVVDQIRKSRNPKSQVEEVKEEDDTKDIRVERHGDQLYLYTADTDEFLAQGSTLQAALDNIQKRYPGRVFKGHLSKDQADSLGITVK